MILIHPEYGNIRWSDCDIWYLHISRHFDNRIPEWYFQQELRFQDTMPICATNTPLVQTIHQHYAANR